jgi:hypothetical protein
MVSRAKETHTTNRVIRVPDTDWEDLGTVVGERHRAQLLREFIAWYLRRPKSPMPVRPPVEVIQAVHEGREVTERVAQHRASES